MPSRSRCRGRQMCLQMLLAWLMLPLVAAKAMVLVGLGFVWVKEVSENGW